MKRGDGTTEFSVMKGGKENRRSMFNTEVACIAFVGQSEQKIIALKIDDRDAR